jgi:hypothetical protein
MNNVMDLIKMAFSKGKPKADEEQANPQYAHNGNSQFPPANNPQYTPAVAGSQAGSMAPQLPHIDPRGRPEISTDDQLNLYRHLTGIISDPSMAHASAGGRPAPNLGIYGRVVHNEQVAKMGYKYFSWLINGCLGLQIVVAAALTALGAGGGSRVAVTIFGAINTIIAGILTFLKGSGLPNRLKYYQTEWKRVREFIELRERDFCRPNCDLDLYGVVGMVEAMYEEVKMDLEASTPDRFAGFSSSRKTMTQQVEAPSRQATITLPRANTEAMSEKFMESGFGSRVKGLATEIGHRAEQARELGKDLQSRRTHVQDDASREFKEYASRAERLEHALGNKMKDLASDIGHKADETRDEATHLAAQRQREIEEAGREARAYAERVEHAASSRLSGPISVSLSGTTALSSQDARNDSSHSSPPPAH